MTPIRILAPSLLAVALASCASRSADQYDTADPYGTYGSADSSSAVNPPAEDAANSIYDTPAAYEESSAAPAPVADAMAPVEPSVSAPPANGAATIHTVVRGDTLSGISKKYGVPIASIKQANRMTNDVVVLDRKLVIPPR